MNGSFTRSYVAENKKVSWSIDQLDQLCWMLEVHNFSMRAAYVLMDEDLRLTNYHSANFNVFLGLEDDVKLDNQSAMDCFPELVGLEKDISDVVAHQEGRLSLNHINRSHAVHGDIYLNYHLYSAGCSDEPGMTLLIIEQLLGVAQIEADLVQKLHKAEEKIDDLSLKAHRDSLTHVSNRRALFDKLRIEVERSHRYEYPLSLMLIDLDNFKQINDKQGHMAGDKILRQFAQQVKRSIRASDMVARYGGDEFVVIQPNATEAEAIALAKRLQNLAAGLKSGISLSIGIVNCPDHAGTDLELLRLADIAMYVSKRTRNTITVYQDDMQTQPVVSMRHAKNVVEHKHSD